MNKILDCGDNSCRFMEMGKGGMRTNGGCRCISDRHNQHEIMRRLLLSDLMASFVKNRMGFLKGDAKKDASELVDQWFDRSSNE